MHHEQLSLFSSEASISLRQLQVFLNENAPPAVFVTLTRNRVSMISVDRSRDDIINIRMHEAFLSAPWPVISGLRSFLSFRHRKDWQIVSEFARRIPATYDGKRQFDELKSEGKVYNLLSICKSVNDEFFSGEVKCRIGWSRGRSARRRRRSRGRYIRFGSWVDDSKVIKVHPLLDDERVPLEFVRYIVFHEMLHSIVPRETRNGRLCDHPPQFRRIERTYPEFVEMKKIAKRIVHEFL